MAEWPWVETGPPRRASPAGRASRVARPETGQNLCAEVLVVPDRSASRRSMPARRKSPTREPENRRLKPIRRDRQRPIVDESGLNPLNASNVAWRHFEQSEAAQTTAAPKYKRAAFSFVMRGLDPRIQGDVLEIITKAPLGCPARGCSRPGKGGGSDWGRRFCVDFSFGETKFMLGCFSRSSGLFDPGRVAASRAQSGANF